MMSAAPQKPGEVLNEFGLVGKERTRAALRLARSLIKLEREHARLVARYPSAVQAHHWIESEMGTLRSRLRLLAQPVTPEEMV
jgi:hypothetical protein